MMNIKKAAVLLACFVASSVGTFVNAQNEKVNYLWIVDTSSEKGGNIYIEGLQHAIDTFYTEVTKTDEIHAYSFAKSFCEREAFVSEDFNKYSDLTLMLEGLDSLISHTRSHYVRAFILSDFFNETPLAGDVPINPQGLKYLQSRLMSTCAEKDIRIYLLVTPPSSHLGGYSLDQVKEILPVYCTESFGVTPDQRTVDYLIKAVKDTNELRGMGTDAEENGTPITTYVILCLFLAVIVGTMLYFYVNKKKTNSTNKNNNSKQKGK